MCENAQKATKVDFATAKKFQTIGSENKKVFVYRIMGQVLKSLKRFRKKFPDMEMPLRGTKMLSHYSTNKASMKDPIVAPTKKYPQKCYFNEKSEKEAYKMTAYYFTLSCFF